MGKTEKNQCLQINEQLILTVSELRIENKKYHDREIVYKEEIMILDNTIKNLRLKVDGLEYLVDGLDFLLNIRFSE